MRNTLLSRTPAPLERTSVMATPPLSQVPTIRLTTATPSTTDTRLPNKPITTTILAPKAQADTRKRLVPKKSKLSLLGGSKKEKSKDFSDVARRVGAPSPTIGRSFDIYVDPADDPDIGEIVVLKKKKSRAGLNDLHWGALDDVTNTGKAEASEKKTEGKKPAPAEASLKAKNDEKEKWWTIGRGRKDSKEKPKDKLRVKSKERLKENAKESSKEIAKNSMWQPAKSRRSTPPEQTRNFETRQRSLSFDAGMLFSASTDPFATNLFATNFISVPMPDEDEETPRRGHARTNTSPSLYGTRPTAPEDIAAVTQPSEDEERPKNGSIALRAIHSVRSLARIGSWAQLKNMPTDDIEQPAEKSGYKTENKERKKKERTRSMRNSRSSFEALKNTFGSVRKSVDLSGTIRSVSSQATAVSTSSDGTVRNNRRQSGASIASTIRNDGTGSPSVEPIIGRASKSSGASTIRWNDQAGTVKERRSPGSESTPSGGTKKRRESKRSPEGRKRPGLASLFSDLRQDSSESAEARERAKFPVQDVHSESPERESETSTTLLDISCVTSLDTPSRRVRPRPLSEQMLGRERPRGIIGDKDTGVIRILDDVTTDLASLINRLDLEATPTASPVAESPGGRLAERSRVNSMATESPLKKPTKQLSMEKLLGSLRAYTHRRKCASASAVDFLGQQIAPLAESKIQPETFERVGSQPVFHRGQKQLWSPSASPPAPHEAAPVFHPLPVPSRPSSKESLVRALDGPRLPELESVIATSFATFGKRRSNGSHGSATPTKAKGKRSRGARGSSVSQNELSMSLQDDVFMDLKARRAHGIRGTLGSVGSQSISLDPDDPNYDIPGELRMLLGRDSDRDTSYSAASDRGLLFERSPAMHPLPPSPGTPPSMPLPPVLSSEPVFRAPLPGELSELYDDAFIASDDENETKKSFDFTAELRKLDCSGAADNRSFVMQLEEAFRTPKKYSLRGLGSKLGFGNEDIPDVPPLPEKYPSAAHEIALPESPTTSEPASEGDFDDSSLSECLSLDRARDEDICMKQPSQTSHRAVFSRPSQGRLDLNFKFGGNSSKGTEITVSPEESLTSSDIVSTPSYHSRNQSNSSFSSAVSGNPMTMADFLAPLSNRRSNQSCSSFNSGTSGNPMTLSDIIPPPSHDSRRHSFSSVNEDESAVLKSIFAKAGNLSNVSLSVDSEGASMNGARQCALDRLTTHSRQNSDVSFSGLSSYSEIRRGFEYGSSRPAFYPPPIPGTATDNSLQVPNADWRNSLLSLGSVSSYGRVLRAGAKDPFDYGVPARPISEDMSYTVDDTFSFLQRDPVRQRVDSGASNYSFDSHSHLRPDVHQRRSRRQVDSIISVTSGPPVSLYNRGFNVGRTSFTWRQRTSSFESIASSFSAQHLGRPGVGDKMFESARDLGIPLASISASPSQMESSMNWQTSYDSIVDGDRDQDSLIDETGHRSLPGSQESLFGYDNHRLTHREPGLLPPHQFRPVSVYSVNSHDSPKRDDDTMISMLGGGYVRRRSIRSTLEGSPCARAEKRQQRYLGRILTRIPSGDDYDYSIEGSPDKARLISRPSFTSVHSFDTANNNSVEGSLDKASLIKRPSFTSIFSVETADHIMDGVVEQNPDVSRLSVYDAHFGGSRMSLARKGLLERQSLENCCLSGQGEDMTNTRPSLAVFRRPEPAARIRGGSTGQASSGGDTPPLSQSRSSSQFTGSQCSIDLDRLNVLLSSSTNPVAESDRERLRRRGSGHRRRISEARASRASSVYETINEETPEILDSLSLSGDHLKHSFDSSMAQNLSVPDINVVRWDNEDVGPALRMIHALQNEARLAVDASRRQWADTAYSADALQSFRPPLNPAGWKALLEHSRKNFGPLPSELHGCARRSRARTVSRPSPYPRNRVFTRPPSDQRPLAPANIPVPDIKITEQVSHPLRDVSVNPNISTNAQPWEPSLSPLKPILPFSAELKGERKEAPASSEDCGPVLPVPGSRTRVLSSARKLVPGSAKRNTGKSPRKTKQNKENAAQGTSIRVESLRFVRPRPRGRPFAAPRALRV